MSDMEDTDFIWRIETGSGVGAYHGGMCDLGNLEADYHQYPYHPSPIEDGLDHDQRTSSHLFGFREVNLARRWFFSIRDLEAWEQRYDAKLAIWERAACRDVHDGRSQSVFIPGGVKVRMPASDLHRLSTADLMANVICDFALLRDSVA